MSKEQYGISRHEMKLVEQAAKRREALRNEYLKLRTNPHRHATGEGGFVVCSIISILFTLTTLKIYVLNMIHFL